MLDQPLGFVAALRMLLDGWMRDVSAKGAGYTTPAAGAAPPRRNDRTVVS
jgi:hypothetical protein